MCSMAASQFKTAGASSTKPGSASSSVTLSNNEVWSWYCARPKKTPDAEQLCSNNNRGRGSSMFLCLCLKVCLAAGAELTVSCIKKNAWAQFTVACAN